MLDYTICEASNPRQLIRAVVKAIAQGYKPIGGIVVDRVLNINRKIQPIYYQAMVKEDRKLFAEKMKALRRRGWTLDEAIANTLNETLEEANAEED